MNASSFREQLVTTRRGLLGQLADGLDHGGTSGAGDADDVDAPTLGTVLQNARGLVGSGLQVYDLVYIDLTINLQVSDLEKCDDNLLAYRG
jgi:hypothetical protein